MWLEGQTENNGLSFLISKSLLKFKKPYIKKVASSNSIEFKATRVYSQSTVQNKETSSYKICSYENEHSYTILQLFKLLSVYGTSYIYSTDQQHIYFFVFECTFLQKIAFLKRK